MKKILFDLMVTQPMGKSKFHGGGEYVKKIFEILSKYNNEAEIIVYYNFDIYMDAWIKNIICDRRISCFDIKDYQQLQVSGLLEKADIYLCGLLIPLTLLKIPDKLKVVAIYHGIRIVEKPIDKTSYICEDNFSEKIKDIIKYLFQEKYREQKRRRIATLFDKCDIVVGSSKSAVYSVFAYYPDIDKNKVKLVYPPLKHITNVWEKFEQREKKILMLGGDRWIKNPYRGLLALDYLFSDGKLEEYSVTIVGEVSKNIKGKLKNKTKYKFLGYVESEELEYLYQTSDLFFYPSLNEGYGYPPMEAMKYGTTCVISSVSSLPEIYGESVYYCNPYDIGEMKARILQAVEHKIDIGVVMERYQRMTTLGNESIKKFCEELVMEDY